MDFWRDLPAGPSPPDKVYVIVECPKGTENKYQYDISKRAFVLDRVLYSAVHYLGGTGFLPSTFDEDGDPLDALVLVSNPTFPGCILTVEPIGVLRMNDESFQDDKILAVPITDPRFAGYDSITSPPKHILKENAYLFETYKGPEGKDVEVQGWEDAGAARDTNQACRKRLENLQPSG